MKREKAKRRVAAVKRGNAPTTQLAVSYPYCSLCCPFPSLPSSSVCLAEI